MARKPPRIYFSFRSPYSWLAHHDLTTRYPEVAERLQWIPFWEPDDESERMLGEAGARFPYTPMTRDKHMYILQDIRRIAAERGLAVSWPLDRDPCWEVPHLAYVTAAAERRGPDVIARVYRARWHEGRDICDRATVAALAADLVLDPERLAHAADDPAVRREGLEALLSACRDGVFGVPYFVNGFDRFWGLDRLPAFVASFGRPPDRPETEPAFADAARTTDWGHAGGCG